MHLSEHNLYLKTLCFEYQLPARCWRKSGNAQVIRRLPDMKPEARAYMVKLMRESAGSPGLGQ